MYKYKKIVFHLSTIIYVIMSLIELVKYMFFDNTLFGLYYLIVTLLIIFFMVPCAYNYKKYYSLARISKLIIIVVLGIFNSFILQHIIFNLMTYVDQSKEFIDGIFIYKNVLKPIIYFILLAICILDFKNEKVIK